MDFGHASRFAARQARLACGDLYPGPVLMPRSLLRAVDPLLAVALGPAREGSEGFATAVERTLRGRPDGPLLLALWASAAAGEVRHGDLRDLVRLMPEPLPDRPATRDELLEFARPRVAALARCLLSLAQRPQPEVLEPAERLGCGLFLTRLLLDLPAGCRTGLLAFPLEDLARAGLAQEELLAGVRTEAVDRFLRQEALWARELLDQGLPASERVGARLGRGLRAAVLRARALLRQLEDARRDCFRSRLRLGAAARWRCALRAHWPVGADPRARGSRPTAEGGRDDAGA